MNKIFKYILIASVITAVVLSFCGCSGPTKNEDGILSDLSDAGFTNEITNTFNSLAELTGTPGYDMSLEILNTEETDTENIYEVSLCCHNTDFEITYTLSVMYTKSKELTYSGYSLTDTVSLMKKKLPKDKIIEDINSHFEELKQTVNTNTKNLEQEISTTELGCVTTVPATITEGILSKESTISVSYVFSGKWNTYIEYVTDGFSWDTDALKGKKWVDNSEASKEDYIHITDTNPEKEALTLCYKKGDKQVTEPTPFPYTTDGKTLKIKTNDFSFEISPDMSVIMSGSKVMPK